MKDLKKRATMPFEVTPIKPSKWIDFITSNPISEKEMDKCPSCGANAIVSRYPSEENCLECGWSND